MGRKEHLQEGLHEIKRKKRVEVKADKKKNPRLKTKRKMRRSTKIATLCLVVSLVACAYSVGLAFFRDPSRNFVNLDYGSVSSAVESGETYSPDRGYSPVDIFARLNWTFSRQKRWYGEMHGTVDTVIQQEIETYKQYDNGILVSADLTKSSLVSGASQFCYLKDEDLVMWRKPVGNASTYRGLETEWQTGEPYRIMTINGEDGFKAKNGLPAYELSVYVIEENTILEASDVNMTEDGLYKISYSLKPETWQEEENGVLVTKGATAYYANQMIFTGGLPEAPVFESINVAFTFDKNWRVFKTEIVESYNAKYGPIAAGCVSTSETKYEYDTERAVSSAYEDYFKQYLGASVDVNGGGTGEKEVTALNCLAEAFGSVLTGPVSLDLDLTLNGTPQKGVVNLDLGGLDLSAPDLTKVSAKARLGAIDLWVQDGKAYIDYGGMKFSLKIEELVSLFGDAIAPEEGESDLLGALAGGEFTVDGNEATLSSVLPIAGVEIPVKFFFKLDENRTASLDHVETEIEIKEKLAVGAKLAFGDETLGELANEEAYVDVLPYAQSLIGLFGSDVLHLDAEYSSDGVQVKGGFDLKVKDGFALYGKLDLGLEKDGISLAKTAELLYTDGEIFVTLDGIKVKANIEETLALLSGYFELPELSLPEAGALDLGKILNEVLSEKFASRFESTKSENLLVLLVEGTELLRAFGVEFDLGTVRLSVGDDALSVDALGAKISLTAGTEFDISTDGYVDILKYASTVIELIQSEVLHANVAYKTDKLSVVGTIDFDVKQVLAKANLTLIYGEIEKAIELIYKDSTIYITLDGLKLSANVEQAIALVENFVEIPEGDTDSKELINNLLSLNFGEVIELSESEDTLTAAIDGTELLEALGLTFDLGQATVKIGASDISLEVLGANVTLTAGTQFEANTDDFIDILKYASTVIELIQSDVLHADVSYKTDKLAIEGTINFDVTNVIAKANLTLTYNEIAKAIELIYKDSTIYITLDGLKLSAKVDEAIALVENFVAIPANDTDSKELINNLLSLNFGEVIKLSESNDTLTAAIDGTKLLNALGLTFDLGDATVKIGASDISLEVLGANVTLTAGAEFEANTDDFIDVVKYAETVIELIQSEVLHADVAYNTEKLSVTGTIDFDVKNVIAKANLTLTYNGIKKAIELVYKDNIIYITLDGLKLSAKVDEAIALVENFVEIPASDTDSKELINQLLSLNFGEVIKLSESNDTLTAAIDGTKLIEALGLTFDLGEATVKIGNDKIDLAVLGANVTLTKGTEFEANTDNFIDVVKYASTVIELIQSEVLHANVSYKTANLKIDGTIDFNIEQVLAKANLTLTYNGITKEIELIYKDNVIYITLDGLKLSANVEQAIGLVEKFVEIPKNDTDSKELINKLVSLNFGEVITLSESNDTLTAAIDGTKLLEALGLTFDLGEATVKIGTDKIDLVVLGANVTITKGTEFEANTENFIDVVKYASTVIELIQSEVLHADVAYNTEKLAIEGTIDFDVKNVIAKADLTLTYGEIEKAIGLIYKDNVIYITLDGLKLSAKVDEAIALVENFVEIPESDTDSKELINQLLSLNFGDVIKLSESDDTLTAAIDGTKLLETLGLTFDLGQATVKIGNDQIDLAVLGANVTLTSGKAFEANTDDFIDVVKYASTVIELIQSEVLHADVSYSTDNLKIAGTIDFDVKNVIAKANLKLTYNGIAKEIDVIYKDSTIYITLDGLKLSAKVEEAIALVENFVAIPENDIDSKELINNLLSLNFGEVIKLSESDDTLTAAIDGTKLLEALGLTFDLGQATVKIGNDQIDLAVLGAEVILTSGTEFDISTDGYVDILKYASTVIELIQSEVLHADVEYKTEKLAIEGTIDFDVKELVAKANLTLKYEGISKSIELIYKENAIYITLDGLKLSAKVEETIALVENFVEIPENDTDSKELINNLLSLNFGEVIKLSESEDTLTAAIDGTKLLEALGLTFELGQATIKIGTDKIDLAVLGANVTLTKGAEFEANTDNFIDVVKYAETVIELIQSDVLHANVSYSTDNLEIAGTIDFDVKNVIAKANLTLTYNEIAKAIELIYKDSTIYITLDGLKLSAKVDEAIALVEKFVEIPASDTDSKELINQLLSLNFGEIIKLSESNDTLTAAIDGTKLLEALGLTFDLGQATVKIGNDQIALEVLGANVTLTKGAEFETNTDDFIDVVKYASTVIELIQSEVLHADVAYKTDKLEIAGTIDFDVKELIAKANLKLTYNGISKEIELIYKESTIYITLDGLKLSANVEEAIALVENFVEIPENDIDSKELINQLLSLNFGQVIKLSESEDTLTAAIDGTELLKALGLTFDLGEATVKIGTDKIDLAVLGAEVTLTSGAPFDVSTDGYVDVLKYASTVIELIQSEVLHADVAYKTEKLAIEGTINFDVTNVIAKANLKLTYNGIAKEIELIYKDNIIYITLDGLKLSAKVEEAIALVENFVEIPASDTDSKELINQLLSLNFGEIIKLSESEDTLTAAIDGTKLLEALGLTFELGQAQVKIGASDISLEVYGANVTLTKGAEFEANTDNFIDVVKYASTVIELIQSDVLHADVSYKTDELSVTGTIDFDVKSVIAKANLTLTYNGIEKTIELIYKDSTIYITLDGLKLSANVEQTIALVQKFVEIPANDTDSKELINNLLSLNFSELIELSEFEDTLTAAIDGTKLLEALGLTFELGNATVKIGASDISLEVLGAEVTLTSGTPFEANTENFIDVVKYASTVIELIQSEVLHADVAYNTEKLAIEGTIDFDVKNVIAKADLTLTYGEIEKAIGLIYKDNVIYITLDGLKLSANVEQAIGLVENFVEISANDTDSKELINNLLSLNFGDVIKLSESDDTLTAAIDGTKLLETLGLTFDLGQAQVKIGAGDISLEALGANVTLTAGTQFEANTDNFIDVVKYASTVIELIQSDVLHADVSYKTDELSVTGTIDFDVKSVIAKANLTLTYNGIEKTIELIYKDSTIYITLDGLKLSAKVEEAIALVENFVEIPESDTDSKELINNLLSLNFGEVIELSESDDTLTAAIDGTKLLEALGLTFELGEATVKIGNNQIDLAVFGANVTLTKGEKFEASADGFIDLAPVLEKIGKIVQNGGLELRGILTLDTENGEIVLEIRRAAISWKDGFKLYLDATLSVAGTAHDVKLYADKTMAKIVYGNVGVEIVYEEVKGLEAKFLQVYDRIADIVNGSFKTESGALLPKASSMKELLTSLLGKVEDTTGTLGNESMQQLFNALQSSGSFLGAFDSVKESSFGSFDPSEILGSLVLSSVLNEGTATGCITAEYKGLKLGVSTAFAKLDDSLPAMVQANISYAGEGISLRESTVYLCELTSFPEMPNITYLCYEDYCELLDFFGAAITTLAEKNVGLNLSGKVLSTDEKYSAVGGEKYTFDASVRFYSGAGEGLPITIDTTKKSISVRSDMYLKIHLALSSKVETGLWLDLIVMDMDPSGKTDGKLDFFVSISKYKEGSGNRSPLSFYAPASEVKTLLSAACILLGVDNSILNDYLIEKGLSLETRSQLQSIGDSLQLASLISGLVGKNDEPAEFAEILEGTKQEENLKRNYLSKFSFEPTRNENGAINGNTLTLALNGKAIYNDANAKDIELVLQKQGESFVSSRLTKVALSGVTSGNETFSLNLGFSYDEIKSEEKTRINVTHNFDGVERLITSIAKSATHTATDEEIISGEAKAHDYVLNRTFYIDGKANVSALDLVKAEIKVIAISVTIDEENKVAVNLRLEYDGKYLFVPLINGDSTVDITIKGGMVYMKRVQTSETKALYDKKFSESEYITIYRTTTLSNFFDDILKHLGFLLNFGDSIVSAIEKSEPAQPTDTTALDYGALVGQYFVGYECKHQNGGEDTWTINLNGNALTDGVLGEIGITFTADKNDIVKDLHVSTKLYSIISLTLDLNWQNPQSANDFKDNQTDRTFADELASKQDGIGETLETHDFTSERFIEYQKGTINYSYHKYNGGGDESLGASDVYYRMSDRTLLNEPHVPDLEAYNNEEFYLTWDNNTFYHKGETFPNEGATITATQKAHMYNVTFVTSGKQAGTLSNNFHWTENGSNKFFTAQMKYNATVKFTANGTTQSRTVDGDTTIELPDATQFHNGAEGEWNLNSIAVDRAEFTAFYPLTVRYYSEIGYNASPSHAAKENYDVKVEDSDYKLITPTASGYTFLGWFTKEGGNWREAKEIASSTVIDGKLMLKVEALWMSDFKATIEASRSWEAWKGYTHTIKGTISGGTLIGAFAKEATISTEYRFYVDNNEKYTEGKAEKTHTFGNYQSNCTDGTINKGTFETAPWAHVVAILTYHYGDITISKTAHASHFSR